MILKLKTLSLTLIVVFAFGAVTASTASATDKFTAEQSPAIVTGHGESNVGFKITASSEVAFVCTTAISTGTVTNGATEVTVHEEQFGKTNITPHSPGEACESAFGNVIVDMNGCGYTLTGNTDGSDGGTDATVWIECPTGKEIVLTNSLCNIKIPVQTPTSGGVTYTNEGSGSTRDVKVSETITGITYTSEGSFCALGGVPSEGNNADYNGTATVKGYQDNSGTEGAQTGISVS
jgi:hypothetical protein